MTNGRTIRIFLSGTFRDFGGERGLQVLVVQAGLISPHFKSHPVLFFSHDFMYRVSIFSLLLSKSTIQLV